MRDYYWRWIKTAISRSFGLSQTIVAFIAAWILPGMEWYLGKTIMTGQLIWQILSGTAIAMLTIRLMLAPFWMHQDDKREDDRVRKERDELLSRLSSVEGDAGISEAQERLRNTREALMIHANEAIPNYTDEKGGAWVRAGIELLNRSVTDEASRQFLSYHNPDHDDYRSAVASLRGLACSLTVDDLKRKNPR